MTTKAAVGEVFYTAFKGLAPAQRGEVLERLLKDKSVQEDVFDLALMEHARHSKGQTISAKTYFDRLRHAAR